MKPEVQEKFDNYPNHIKPLLLQVRELIFSIAEELNLGEVDETLKWGEPSYQVKSGSPIRIDWKANSPNQYFLFFHCQTKLIDTFRELYSEVFEFEGNRAIVFHINQKIPINALTHCMKMAMNYKKLRHLPLLGA
jgi:hypothetical protein